MLRQRIIKTANGQMDRIKTAHNRVAAPSVTTDGENLSDKYRARIRQGK